MNIEQFEIWIADLNPRMGTEPGKTRPVVIMQTNLLNQVPHPSTIICPITSNVKSESNLLRVHVKKGVANMHEDCDMMIDQIRAIDNRRFIKKIGKLPKYLIGQTMENIKIVLDIDPY